MSAPGTSRPAAPTPLRVGPREFVWGARTYVMGILNITTDSFSGDGLAHGGAAMAVERARRMADEGADMLDIGGESTRPGASPVSAGDERARVLPVIEALAAALPGMPLSIDTMKAGVAAAALDAGAHWVNDVSGLLHDPAMAALIAERGVPCVLMFNARYAERAGTPLADARAGLTRALASAGAAGIAGERVVLDPGFGFGLKADESIALLRGMGELRALGRPLLAGTSRKSMIGAVLDLPPEERLEGTAATVALAIAGGADIVRVHDIAAMVRVARMADAVVRGWPR